MPINAGAPDTHFPSNGGRGHPRRHQLLDPGSIDARPAPAIHALCLGALNPVALAIPANVGLELSHRAQDGEGELVALAEHLRGPLPERERNALIGANIQRTLRNAVRNLGGHGKAMVIFSPEREFIFGDGFFHNLTVQGDHWHHPKLLAPLTPWMSVLFTRPMSYSVEPRLVTFVANRAEADELNYAVQVHAREMLFYRSERPQVDEAFTCGAHKTFADSRNAVDTLIHQIPGVPPRDPRMDALMDLIDKHSGR